MSELIAAISDGSPREDSAEYISQLWDELAEFDAAHHDEALTHLMAGLCRLLGAQNASWFGAVRLPDVAAGDPIHGWRPRFVRYLHPTAPLEAATREMKARLEQPGLDITVIRNISFAGRLRANRLVDLAPPEWFHSDWYRHYFAAVGRVDAIWAGCPVNADTEVYFGIFRDGDHAPFTRADCDLTVAALRGLRWFHRQYLLSHGVLVASAPLGPAEREVLQGLLAGLSEKQIAAAQERTLNTVHEYVKMIYRKFGVRSRASLMALWLGRMS